MLSRNIGTLDRFIRFLVGSGLIIWGIYEGYLWIILGVVLLLTVFTARCLVYQIAGFSSFDNPSDKKKKDMRYSSQFRG